MSEISKTIRTYRIDGNPQADVLYDVFAMWADEVAQLEAQVEALQGRVLHDGVMRLSILGIDEAEHGAEVEWERLSDEDKQWWIERAALLREGEG